ncbi:MAG: hypothetical protein EU530_09500 [Promethearchaeota archaeon]|nr:MAG: hypothetical protein EU530_09500 [Candidatus Lokiarchaeota archaeon]
MNNRFTKMGKLAELSSVEDVDTEIEVLVNEHKTYFDKDLKILHYIRSLEFKYKFKSIQETDIS